MVSGMEKVLGTSKLSSKFQVTIPKDAREELNLGPGDRVVFILENRKLILKKG